VGASSSSVPGKGARKLLLIAGRITTQLGTPRGRYDEYSSNFSLSKKPRFNHIQEKAKL
jgi:hypothetical protein